MSERVGWVQSRCFPVLENFVGSIKCCNSTFFLVTKTGHLFCECVYNGVCMPGGSFYTPQVQQTDEQAQAVVTGYSS